MLTIKRAIPKLVLLFLFYSYANQFNIDSIPVVAPVEDDEQLVPHVFAHPVQPVHVEQQLPVHDVQPVHEE